MQLTEEQVEAAVAGGCSFVEASEAQVRQFSMQRRIFYIEGRPFLAARGDGFYETAGTLTARMTAAMQQSKVDEAEAEQVTEPPPSAAVSKAVEEPEPDQEPAPQELEPIVEAAPTAEPPTVPVAPRDAASTVMSAMSTIATGYMRGRNVDAAELSALLTTVHRTLSGLKAAQARHPRPAPG